MTEWVSLSPVTDITNVHTNWLAPVPPGHQLCFTTSLGLGVYARVMPSPPLTFLDPVLHLPNPMTSLTNESCCSQLSKESTLSPSKEFSSVHSVVSDSLQPHGLQHARPPCSSPAPGVYPNSCPLSQWCHQTISSSVVPFSSCLQSFPASGSFQMSQFFPSGGQSIGVSASASVLPMNTQDWSPLGWTGWISLQSKGLSRVFSNTTVQKHQFFSIQLSSQSNSHITHDYWKNHSLD